MENGAFAAGPADSLTPPPPRDATGTQDENGTLEMKTQHSRGEEKQPLCRCDEHCACVEAAETGTSRTPGVRVKTWSRPKTVAMAVSMAALLVWCAVMAAMRHYGVL